MRRLGDERYDGWYWDRHIYGVRVRWRFACGVVYGGSWDILPIMTGLGKYGYPVLDEQRFLLFTL